MKSFLVISTILLMNMTYSQVQNDDPIEDQEIQSENTEEEIEDDSWMEQLQFLRRHPLNINMASETELAQFGVLSPLQINNLLRYRSLLGPLIHINELQAVPGWTPDLIRKLMPFITINENTVTPRKIWSKIKGARTFFLIRTTQQLQKTESSKFIGSPQHVLAKFDFNNDKDFQSGFLLEKDAGEPWLVNKGFDFTSFHFFIQRVGLVRQLAIGDFQINMGQGLIQWQGMSTKKSANVLMIKRQEPILKPYRSAGEINFYRGIAVTMGNHNWELMTYASFRKLSANVVMDSLNNSSISSIINSGYHRTAAELNDRNTLKQFSTGAKLSYGIPNGVVAVNIVQFNYSLPFQRKEDPYQLFAFHGRNATNSSIDYSYTFRNIHLFGEFAVDANLNKAWLNGVLMSLDKQLDVSLLFRSIARSYISINGNAFTENSEVNNETGFYAGLSLRISPQWKLDGYADIFYCPWLKYRVNGSSVGSEFVCQGTWTASKRLTIYGRWKIENKEENNSLHSDPITGTQARQRKSFRAHISWDCNSVLSLRERWETVYYKSEKQEKGALWYTDLNFHPPFKPFDLSGRVLFFETDGYNSRIYTFERNVLNSFSVPFFSGKGAHISVNLHCDIQDLIKRKWFRHHELECYFSLSSTVYAIDAFQQIPDAKPQNATTVRVQFIVE